MSFIAIRFADALTSLTNLYNGNGLWLSILFAALASIAIAILIYNIVVDIRRLWKPYNWFSKVLSVIVVLAEIYLLIWINGMTLVATIVYWII